MQDDTNQDQPVSPAYEATVMPAENHKKRNLAAIALIVLAALFAVTAISLATLWFGSNSGAQTSFK